MCQIDRLSDLMAARHLERRKAFYERADDRVGAGLDKLLGRALAIQHGDCLDLDEASRMGERRDADQAVGRLVIAE